MAGDFISTWAWVFWLALILIFAIIEVNTLDLTFLMLALGSIGGLIAGLLGIPWWWQAALRPTAPCGHGWSRRARRTASARSCPAGRCAPTTRR